MLLKCTQYARKFGKLSSGHRTGKGQFFIPIPKKGNAKEHSNYHTVALISHASRTSLVAQMVESVHSAGDLGSIPGSGRLPGEGNGNPVQYSCLENPMDGGAWCRLLSMGSQRAGHDFTFTFTC